eukprot:m.262066 g.262066  ORF g.262066 m.262066 type:complete len:307 (-) comp11047_c0_seq6:2442-3362(-)
MPKASQCLPLAPWKSSLFAIQLQPRFPLANASLMSCSDGQSRFPRSGNTPMNWTPRASYAGACSSAQSSSCLRLVPSTGLRPPRGPPALHREPGHGPGEVEAGDPAQWRRESQEGPAPRPDLRPGPRAPPCRERAAACCCARPHASAARAFSQRPGCHSESHRRFDPARPRWAQREDMAVIRERAPGRRGRQFLREAVARHQEGGRIRRQDSLGPRQEDCAEGAQKDRGGPPRCSPEAGHDGGLSVLLCQNTNGAPSAPRLALLCVLFPLTLGYLQDGAELELMGQWRQRQTQEEGGGGQTAKREE